METTELKGKLIEKIRNSSDKEFLKFLLEIFPSENTYKLTVEEEEAVNLAKEQINNNESYSHSEVMQNLEKWLEK
ncbi:MAG: hypothetical protein ACQEWD_07045 [Bacteroidota bacterium]